MEKLKLPNGKIVTKVDKEEYLLCEKNRNYILRMNYELGLPIWICRFRAAKKFNVPESYCLKSLREWKKWYYDNGLRHRPLELFIKEAKEKENENL